jgi:hypothetical protein
MVALDPRSCAAVSVRRPSGRRGDRKIHARGKFFTKARAIDHACGWRHSHGRRKGGLNFLYPSAMTRPFKPSSTVFCGALFLTGASTAFASLADRGGF